MNKKSRFILILVVLGLCFAFLWPTITWYVRTPKDRQALALSSLEYIKDYSVKKAFDKSEELLNIVKNDSAAEIPEDLKWLEKKAKKNYKNSGMKAPKNMNLKQVLESFDSKAELRLAFEDLYREEILTAKRNYKNSVKLGLDLSGGMNVIVKADLDSVVAKTQETNPDVDVVTLKSDAMTQTVETLSSRIDRFGLTSPIIRQQGEDRIYIELPGSAEADQINSIIQGRGILNFRLLDDKATNDFIEYYNNNLSSTFDSQGRLIDPSIIPADCEVLGYYVTDDYGLDQRQGYLVVKKDIVLDGKHIKDAQVGQQELSGKPQVNFVLDSEGAEIFGKFTGDNVGKNLCIVSDNKIKSSATIQSAIPNGQVAITGFGYQEANNLKKVLQSAWLEVPLSVESQQVIGADLGEQATKQGIIAIAIGLISIMIFMLLWYKGAGVNACVVQILNLYIMGSFLSALNLTLTLPMIAGMILTIGMAVDSNVIIFERIKEELVLGKDRAAAISSGFGNAFWSIMDSNITTLIAALFMSKLGSGSIQGFSYSLAIGVCSTLFTTLIVSRLIFDFDTDVMKRKNISISWRIK